MCGGIFCIKFVRKIAKRSTAVDCKSTIGYNYIGSSPILPICGPMVQRLEHALDKRGKVVRFYLGSFFLWYPVVRTYRRNK